MRNPSIQVTHAHARPLPTSPRGHEMALAFSLRLDEPPVARCASTGAIPLPAPGQILLLCGASGSGKSSLLRVLARRARSHYALVNLRSVALANRPMIDLFEQDIPQTLRRLSAVGLAEVWSWLRRPRELSEGQRWRLRLALALCRAERLSQPVLLVCDEFGAVLDRTTARIVAACVRRAVDARPLTLCALLATSHDDLFDVLDPDLRIDCDFGRHTLVTRDRREP